ncbi:MAG: sugar transferase [Chloroflexi bacterium]|nr:sugar transferase [Chloroflexota bacterium]
MKDVIEQRAWRQQSPVHRGVLDSLLCDLVDYALSALAILLLSPIFLVLAMIVKLDSPGPVLYRRRVMGRDGSQFDAFKFRTMVVNGAEILAAQPELLAQWQRDQKLKHDPRVTRSGFWMRKLSLDELPQLFNVLLGQMSLVGPRMISPSELAHYGEYAEELLTTKPGITGIWQISGRSDLDRGDRVRLDIEYVRARSVWLNIKLIVMTVPAVLWGKGAY